MREQFNTADLFVVTYILYYIAHQTVTFREPPFMYSSFVVLARAIIIIKYTVTVCT